MTLHFKDSKGIKHTVKSEDMLDLNDQEGLKSLMLSLGFHTKGPILATYHKN